MLYASDRSALCLTAVLCGSVSSLLSCLSLTGIKEKKVLRKERCPLYQDEARYQCIKIVSTSKRLYGITA